MNLCAKMSECENGLLNTPASVPDQPTGNAEVRNASVRNVQTQHGDYRTVDEENIVVLPLARCHSPEPVVNKEGDDDDSESVVWIEPFAEENQVSELVPVLFVAFCIKFCILLHSRQNSGNS